MSDHAVILTVHAVCQKLTISEATLRRYSKTEPGFPRKLRLGPRRVGYLKADVDSYLANRLEVARHG